MLSKYPKLLKRLRTGLVVKIMELKMEHPWSSLCWEILEHYLSNSGQSKSASRSSGEKKITTTTTTRAVIPEEELRRLDIGGGDGGGENKPPGMHKPSC